jgi:hypothetical protein
MSANPDTRSVPTLVGDLIHQVTTLVQTEGRLLRAEMSNKISQAENGALAIVAGAILLLAALLVLVQALVVALAAMGLGAGWASLLVGVVLAAIGAVLVKTGTSNLAPSNLTPERTQEQLKRDAQVAREQLK